MIQAKKKMFILGCLCVVSSLFSMSRPKAPPSFSNIGVHTIEYFDEKRSRPVVVELWYPTEQEGPFDEPEDFVWVHPKEIRDVPICQGKYPLILMSHGHGGDRRDRSWLVEEFVKNGFVVASVEHFGSCWKNLNPLLTLRFWERAKDISFVLSSLFKEDSLKGRIDRNKVGFIGYSMGGMTGLALGGARIEDMKQVALEHLKEFQEAKIDPKVLELADFSEGTQNFSDQRIKALALLSPAAFGFSPKSIEKIRVPVALVYSEKDEVLPEEHSTKLINFLKTKKRKVFQGNFSHYVFLNRVSDAGKALVRPDIQTKKIELERLNLHEKFASFLLRFFKESLALDRPENELRKKS